MNATERNLIKDTVLHVFMFAAVLAWVVPVAVHDVIENGVARAPAATVVAFAPAGAPLA
jgi:hypothetical protein